MTDPFPFPTPSRAPGPPTFGVEQPGGAVAEVGIVGDDAPVDGARRRRLALLLVGSGLLLIGGGTAAAVSLFGLPGTGDDAEVAVAARPSEPAPSATPSRTDLDTAAPTGNPSATAGGSGDPAVGRNVFAPLVDAGPGAAGSSGTGTATATSAPTSSSPAVATVSTVTVPGPTVTNTQLVAGPTVTATRTVTSTSVAGYQVQVVSVADTASATTGVTFTVDGSSVTVAHNGSFGPAGAFTYTGYDTIENLVAFTNGSISVTLPVGATIVFP